MFCNREQGRTSAHCGEMMRRQHFRIGGGRAESGTGVTWAKGWLWLSRKPPPPPQEAARCRGLSLLGTCVTRGCQELELQAKTESQVFDVQPEYSVKDYYSDCR